MSHEPQPVLDGFDEIFHTPIRSMDRSAPFNAPRSTCASRVAQRTSLEFRPASRPIHHSHMLNTSANDLEFDLLSRDASTSVNTVDSTQSQHFTSIEVCAGAGGQALGLEKAGFDHRALVEIDSAACETLKYNRPEWNVIEGDLREFSGTPYRGIDLFAGGLPCPPFSVAGKQLGENDERDMFPTALRLIKEIQPKAVMIENVRGILSPRFDAYRRKITQELNELGFEVGWRQFNAKDFGVCQVRQRVILVALRSEYWENFRWPVGNCETHSSVGETLADLMASNGWKQSHEWAVKANGCAPTIVGGSKKHGGPDLGPTRAKREWAELSVDGHGIANDPPNAQFLGSPKLTVRMVARLQGFDDSWHFCGKKTSAYRQVGNAFPPPVAHAVAKQIRSALAGQTNQVGILEDLFSLAH